jgi:arabinofuranan 3-O-arabinosyltransferase
VEVHDNFTAGWTAALNGRPLTAVRLDGWQQAFIVPAGQGGVIRLSYAPATVYHAGLIVAALALVVLALITLLASGRSGPLGFPRRPAFLTRLRAPEGGLFPRRFSFFPRSSLLRRDKERALRLARRLSRRSAVRTAAVFVPLAVVIWLVGGLAVLAVPALACVAWWRPRWLPPIAFGAMLAAGVAAASAGNLTATGSGAFGGLAQACALVALTAALMPAVARTAAAPASNEASHEDGAA